MNSVISRKIKARLLLVFVGSILFCNHSFSQNDSIFKDKFLIVLDMQQDYITGKISDKGTDEFVENVNKIIVKVDTNRIIYVKTEMIVASLSFKGISVDTIANLDFCRNLKITNENIYIKEGGNAFANSDLLAYLKDRGAKDIIIVGLLAEKCIFNTTIGGIELGYNIYLVPNAILGKKKRTKKKTMNKLKNKGAKLLFTDN